MHGAGHADNGGFHGDGHGHDSEHGHDCDHAHGGGHSGGHGHGAGHGPSADQKIASESLLEMGKRALMSGDPDSAVQHLEAELSTEGGASVDVHLLLAEALWQKSRGKGDEGALRHYEAAADLARAAGDSTKEGMIALGHGFALSKLGHTAAASTRLELARKLAEADGNEQAAQFASNLLSQVNAADPTAEDSELMRTMWRQFAEAVAASKPAQLFMRGTMGSPLDEASSRAVSRLRAAGCLKIDVLDVEEPGEHVPEGLQGVSRSPHLEFPQLFVGGEELPSWLDLTPEQLRERLQQAGLELGEMPAAEPCHGAAAFSDGLEPWEVALVELVSKEGAGDWASKAKLLEEHLPSILAAAPASTPATTDAEINVALALEVAWERLAPLVKDKLDKQTEMPCGHSCATCPTRHDCQLHDAVEGGAMKDIEDLG